jgi:glycosyltransferase involved in cell wall biosynthesis
VIDDPERALDAAALFSEVAAERQQPRRARVGVGRVLLVGALPPPSGGVASHCQELRSALGAYGLAVRLIDPRRLGPDGSDGRTRLLAELLRARCAGDLVHVHTNGHNRRSWMLAALCAGGHTGPSLLTLHSGLAPEYVRLHHSVARFVCNRFTGIVAVNEEIAEALLAAGVAAERLTVCPAFTPQALALRLSPPGLRQTRRAHPLLLACALAPGPEYGALTMLDAFRLVRMHHERAGLILYGPGTRHPALAAAVRARGLAGAVHHFGELTRTQALAVIAAADLFVRPSLADGDALSVREALALACQVVASDVGARPGGVRLFPAGDAAACAEQIFLAVANRLSEQTPPMDCLPILLALYARLGARLSRVATGTPLASLG